MHSGSGKYEIFAFRDGDQDFVDLSTEPDQPDPDDVDGCYFTTVSEGGQDDVLLDRWAPTVPT